MTAPTLIRLTYRQLSTYSTGAGYALLYWPTSMFMMIFQKATPICFQTMKATKS